MDAMQTRIRNITLKVQTYEMLAFRDNRSWALQMATNYGVDVNKTPRFYTSMPDMPEQFEGAFPYDAAEGHLRMLVHNYGFDFITAYLTQPCRDQEQVEDEILDAMLYDDANGFDAGDILNDLGYQIMQAY